MTCRTCDGKGYALVERDDVRKPLEIQACKRCRQDEPSGGAIRFVMALEGDDLRADRIALALIAGDYRLSELPDPEAAQDDALRELVSAVRYMLNPDEGEEAMCIQRVANAVKLFDSLEV